MSDHRHTIRNLDRETVQNARIYALQTGRTLGELVNESLEFFMAEADDDCFDETSEDPDDGVASINALLQSQMPSLGHP